MGMISPSGTNNEVPLSMKSAYNEALLAPSKINYYEALKDSRSNSSVRKGLIHSENK